MKISKFIHRNEARIRIDFQYDTEIIAKLKQIKEIRWSKTIKAWHIPYSKEAFEQLKSIFPDVQYPESKIESPEQATPKVINSESTILQKKTIKLHANLSTENTVPPPPINNLTESNLKKPEQTATEKSNNNLGRTQNHFSDIYIDIYPRNIVLRIPKNEADIQFVRSFKYARWNTAQFSWSLPNFGRNAEVIKSYFNGRNAKINEHFSKQYTVAPPKTELPTYTKNDFLAVNNSNRVIRVYFSFNPDINYHLRNIPMCVWMENKRCWELPYSEKYMGELVHIANEFKLNYIYFEEKKLKVLPRKSRFDVKNYRECPQNFTNKLKELRYSKNTLAVYTDMFEEFINFFENSPIDAITEKMIVEFLNYLVNERHVSTSYQNQSINAIKFYYERVLGGQRKLYVVDRPREEKFLPEVLSTDEVAAILQVTDNLKHKAILMTIYSAGLRIGEAINLKLKDIDSQRMQIRVEQAKGKKDRYTVLSSKTLDVLREYVKEYRPKNLLFEGVDGGSYSQKGIQQILKRAVLKVGIKKHVTVHTLRHSFATHLLEGGTDIRYIQSLLGHESSKTTEIYTHITGRGLQQIKSPLDKINI